MEYMATANSEGGLYKPSIFDRFTNWVRSLPIRAWIFYIGLGLFLILIQMVFLWLDGGLQAEALFPVIIFNGLAAPFLLGLIHLLDDQAVAALNAMRPSLDITEAEFEGYHYRLSTMPVLAPIVAAIIMMVIFILIEQLSIAPLRYAALDQLPVFSVLYQFIDKLSAFLFGTFLYHTVRQLRLVNTLKSDHARVNLFHIEPLQAFSKLTATTAVSLVFGIYGWMLLNPELLGNPVSLGFSLLISVLALVVFIWPLYGVHQLMETEKSGMLHEIDQHFETVFTKFNQRFVDGEFMAVEGLNRTIASLEIQNNRIKASPTWPWKPETARVVITAIALPLVLMILQFFVERAMGW